MKHRQRWNAKLLVAGLVLLALSVVGGLVWVTATALKAEANEFTNAQRATATNSERLALWRLDSFLLSPLGLENNRPFTNYTALASPAPIILDDAGFPVADPGRVPSPLLSAEVPPWMLLHFELDRERGWRSPQVLPTLLASRLSGDPLHLSLSNCTDERKTAVRELRQLVPFDTALRQLQTQEDLDPETSPVILPVSIVDSPSTEKPDWLHPDNFNSRPGLSLPEPVPATVEQVRELEKLRQDVNSTISQAVSPDAAARKKAAVNSMTARGNYELQNNGLLPQMFKDDNLKAKPLDQVATNTNPQQEQLKQTNEWVEKQAKTIQGRAGIPQSGSTLADAAKVPGGPFGGGGGYGGNLEKKGNGLGSSKPGAPADSGSEAKPPPVVLPTAIRLTSLRTRWLIGTDGVERMALVRQAQIGERICYQGILVDWPKLRDTLLAEIHDLFPQATLEFLREGQANPADLQMTTLPVLLNPNTPYPAPPTEWTPLRIGLVLAWAAALLAMVATALGARAILSMAERRIRFASAVTHELRSPLTAMQLHLDLLNSGLITDETKKAEYLRTLADESDRLNRLVENVLDFAKLEKSSALVNARVVPLADILVNVEQTWSSRLEGDRFQLRTDMSPALVASAIFVDARVLDQVLGNLIDNARKYAKPAEDRRIEVRIHSTAEHRVCIDVRDYGPGVAAAERKAIFKPFSRGSAACETGGAGLGLALAKEWAELFGGTLEYIPGEPGACFRLAFPIRGMGSTVRAVPAMPMHD
jgi:signal transduction histidine kinase